MGSWLKTEHNKHVVIAMPKALKGTLKQLKMFTGFTVWTMISSKIQEASKVLKGEDVFESRLNFVCSEKKRFLISAQNEGNFNWNAENGN